MEFIDRRLVFSIILPIITTLGVYLLTGAPSLLILGMLSSVAVVVIHFLPHENQNLASEEAIVLDELNVGEQYDYLRGLLEPLDRNPHFNEITVRLRDSLHDVYIVDDFLCKLHQLVRNWIIILRGAQDSPGLNALRTVIAPYTMGLLRTGIILKNDLD